LLARHGIDTPAPPPSDTDAVAVTPSAGVVAPVADAGAPDGEGVLSPEVRAEADAITGDFREKFDAIETQPIPSIGPIDSGALTGEIIGDDLTKAFAEDTYLSQQAGATVTQIMDVLPSINRATRSNAMMLLEKVAGKDFAQAAADFGYDIPLWGPVYKGLNGLFDKSGVIKREMAEQLMRDAYSQAGGIGEGTARVSQTIQGTLLNLMLFKAIGAQYGKNPGALKGWARSRKILAGALKRTGIMTAKTEHESPSDMLKNAGLSFLYQSTPAVSGWMNNNVGAIAADIALNTVISSTQANQVVQLANEQAQAEGKPEKAGLYATMSFIEMLGSDAVFGFMTRSFKSTKAPNQMRDGLVKLNKAGREIDMKERLNRAAFDATEDMIAALDRAEQGLRQGEPKTGQGRGFKPVAETGTPADVGTQLREQAGRMREDAATKRDVTGPETILREQLRPKKGPKSSKARIKSFKALDKLMGLEREIERIHRMQENDRDTRRILHKRLENVDDLPQEIRPELRRDYVQKLIDMLPDEDRIAYETGEKYVTYRGQRIDVLPPANRQTVDREAEIALPDTEAEVARIQAETDRLTVEAEAAPPAADTPTRIPLPPQQAAEPATTTIKAEKPTLVTRTQEAAAGAPIDKPIAKMNTAELRAEAKSRGVSAGGSSKKAIRARIEKADAKGETVKPVEQMTPEDALTFAKEINQLPKDPQHRGYLDSDAFDDVSSDRLARLIAYMDSAKQGTLNDAWDNDKVDAQFIYTEAANTLEDRGYTRKNDLYIPPTKEAEAGVSKPTKAKSKKADKKSLNPLASLRSELQQRDLFGILDRLDRGTITSNEATEELRKSLTRKASGGMNVEESNDYLASRGLESLMPGGFESIRRRQQKEGSALVPSKSDMDTAVKTMQRATRYLSTEGGFKSIGAGETGFQTKAYASKKQAAAQKALDAVKELNAEVGKNPVRAAHAFFQASNPKHIDRINVSAEDKASIKRTGEALSKFMDDYYGLLESRDVLKAPWPDSHINRLSDQMKEWQATKRRILDGKMKRTAMISVVKDAIKGKDSKVGADVPITGNVKARMLAQIDAKLAEAKQDIDRLESMRYMHFPARIWLADKLTNDPEGFHTILSGNFKGIKGRRTIDPFDLTQITDKDGKPVLDISKVDVRDATAAYVRYVETQLAQADIRDAAIKDGVVMDEKAAPSDWVTLRSDEFPAFAGRKVHPVAALLLKEQFNAEGYGGGKADTYDRVAAAVKMSQFANPIIMPMYDTLQGFALTQGVGVRNLPKAIMHAVKHTPEYYEAAENGLFSKPYADPWSKFQEGLERTKAGAGIKGLFASEAKKFTSSKGYGENIVKAPFRALKDVYRASWATAWAGDEAIRMASYLEMRRRGFDPRTAAQLAAEAHADYAGVPSATRKVANRVLFTPTFQISMMKWFGKMMTSTAKVPKHVVNAMAGKGVSPEARKDIARGASMITAVGSLLAGDYALTVLLGWKRDEFGRKYTKDVEDEKGEKKEVVVTFSNPINVPLKYYHQFLRSREGMTKFEQIGRYGQFHLHPMLRIGGSLAKNQRPNGDPITNPWAGGVANTIETTRFIAGQVAAMVRNVVDEPDYTKSEAFKLLRENDGKAMDQVFQAYAFAYIRQPEDMRYKYRVQGLTRRFTEQLRKRPPKTKEDMDRLFARLDKDLVRIQESSDKETITRDIAKARRKQQKAGKIAVKIIDKSGKFGDEEYEEFKERKSKLGRRGPPSIPSFKPPS